jgi:hypothetical protein
MLCEIMDTNNKQAVRQGFTELKLVQNSTIAQLLEQAGEPVETTFAEALKVVQQVMREGARKHPANDWKQRSVDFHMRRAQLHLSLLRNGDRATSEDHLSHAATRLLMAVTLRERESGRGR